VSHRRRVVIIALLAVMVAAYAAATARAEFLGSDPWQNIGPSRTTPGLAGKYGWERYDLDSHVDVSLNNPGGAVGELRQETAATLWDIGVVLPMKLAVDAFGWAFSLDLITGADGVLPALASAIQRFQSNVLDQGWMLAAIAALGAWACLQALRRRPGEILAAFMTSATCAVVAMVMVAHPLAILGGAADFANGAAGQFLTAFQSGPGDERNPQTVVTDHLFDVFVYKPWAVLEFGGLRHCVNTRDRNPDGYPTPVAVDDPTANVCRDHLHAHDGYGGYAPRFLAQAPGSPQRDLEYEALKTGEIPAPAVTYIPPGQRGQPQPAATPQFPAGYHVDKADSAAVDIQQEGGARSRVRMAALMVLAAIPAFLLLGRFAATVVIAVVVAVGLYALAPVAAVVGIIPGSGHRFVKWWLSRLATAVFIKVIYAIIVAIIVAVAGALYSLTDSHGFETSTALVAMFYWTALIFRKTVSAELANAISGRESGMSGRSRAVTAAAAYAAFRPVRAMVQRGRRAAPDIPGRLRQRRESKLADGAGTAGTTTAAAGASANGNGNGSGRNGHVPAPDSDQWAPGHAGPGAPPRLTPGAPLADEHRQGSAEAPEPRPDQEVLREYRDLSDTERAGVNQRVAEHLDDRPRRVHEQVMRRLRHQQQPKKPEEEDPV
jgi:hypothetical protein